MEETLGVSWFICLNSVYLWFRLSTWFSTVLLVNRERELFPSSCSSMQILLILFNHIYLLCCRLKPNLLLDASMCQTCKPGFIWEIQIIELYIISLWPRDLMFIWFKLIMCLSGSWCRVQLWRWHWRERTLWTTKYLQKGFRRAKGSGGMVWAPR